jgi:HSP20 family molecular chaperone IbpA
MLVRFQPVTSIFDEIDSLINSTLIPFPEVRFESNSGRIAGVSVNESAEQVTVRVELPGVSKQDIQ